MSKPDKLDRPDRLQILVAHERPVLGQAVRRVLEAQGLRVEIRVDGDRVAEALRADAWDALILDVALPGVPVHELVELAKGGLPVPVKAVILVASVFRRTSYKRKPQQLYGADDYVEIHHLGEQLPSKLWRALGVDPSGLPGMVEAEAALATLESEAGPDDAQDPVERERDRVRRVAELVVADLILYSGDKLLGAETLAEARTSLAPELAAARQLLRPVLAADTGDDPVEAALMTLLRALGGPEGAWT